MIHIYTDGACLRNPGPGGWAAIVLTDGESPYAVQGWEPKPTTNNRMEIWGALGGLQQTPQGAQVTIHTDSTYLIGQGTGRERTKANADLVQQLRKAQEGRTVRWEKVPAHSGLYYNEMADRLAKEMMVRARGERSAGSERTGLEGPTSQQAPAPSYVTDAEVEAAIASLTHLDQQGQARMVDVGPKEETQREAVAKGAVVMQPETLRLIQQGQMEKGDVLSVARIAGIMAAKRTSELIPLCHPLPLDQVTVELAPDPQASAVQITATARTTAKTGVEMEALTAVTIAALTLYDMVKAVDRGMRIDGVRLVRKSGGQSGDIVLE